MGALKISVHEVCRVHSTAGFGLVLARFVRVGQKSFLRRVGGYLVNMEKCGDLDLRAERMWWNMDIWLETSTLQKELDFS